MRRALPVLVLLLSLAQGAVAQRLTAGIGAGPTSMDPHLSAFTPNFMLGFHVYQALTTLDADLARKPGIALSWRAEGEGFFFDLDPTARFSDGATVTAADVAASLARAPGVGGAGGGFGTFLGAVAGTEVAGPHRILIRTRGPAPSLPRDLARVAIVPAAARETPTAEFNAGRVPGSGPFRLVSFAPGSSVVLARNPAHAGPTPAWTEVTFRPIPNNAARAAALLAGDVDIIDSVPTTDLERLRADSRLEVVAKASNRVIYLASNLAPSTPTVTGRDGSPLPDNPLRDPRVRRALSLALDRPAIVARVLDGAGDATGQIAAVGLFGHDPSIPVSAPDPAAARRLLAEAGYPNGFTVALVGPNDRYVNDERVLQAVASMWQRIGVVARVEALPWTVFSGRQNAAGFGVMLGGAAVGTGDASLLLRLLVGSRGTPLGFGALNHGGYANPAYDALLARALSTPEDGPREALLREATRMAMDDLAIIPLHVERATWAMRRHVAYPGRADQYTMAGDVRPR